jgi:hypothetical protein
MADPFSLRDAGSWLRSCSVSIINRPILSQYLKISRGGVAALIWRNNNSSPLCLTPFRTGVGKKTATKLRSGGAWYLPVDERQLQEPAG